MGGRGAGEGLGITTERHAVFRQAVESMRKELAEAHQAAQNATDRKPARAVESMRKEVAEAHEAAQHATNGKPARGRPKGSTNKAKAEAEAAKGSQTPNQGGHPKGSTNKAKAEAEAAKQGCPKAAPTKPGQKPKHQGGFEKSDNQPRGPKLSSFSRGRPKGSTNKAKAEAEAAKGTQTVTKLSSSRVNNIFTHLRKVAQHPLLVRNRYTDEDVYEMAQVASSQGLYAGNCSMERVQKEMMEYNDHALHRFAELLPKLKADGSRVLLFSQWTTVLDVLEWFMDLQGLSYVRLDGDTMVDERLTLVDRFNDASQGIDVFLLSTRAGGQGLNLTGADIVVLHDVDFNPQVDRQAEDRCHRLGQTKPVTVYRLVTKGTVDESILGIADRKLALDAAVLEGFTLSSNGDQADNAEGDEPKGKKGMGKETKYMGAILASLLADA
eukprot:gene32246-16812_t